jgi:alanyl-tRNA synthetase
MDKETFKKLAQNPDLISGIYNYCDRWCERCAFTARCLTYLTEQHDENLQSYDMESKEFWTNLEDSFKLTFELLEEMAQEQGIDLNLLEADRHQEKRRAEIRKQAEEHECAQAACKYMNMASEWLKTAQDLFKQKSDSGNQS